MDWTFYVFGIGLLSIPFVFIASGIYTAIRFYIGKKKRKLILARDVEPLLRYILQSRFPYFLTLDALRQEEFMARVSHFVTSKQFVPREGLLLTDEMPILISATAIQLTFGLEEFDLADFHSILIYPGTYRAPSTGNQHKGETNLAGIIAFSWRHFDEGLRVGNDSINLGLHEFAHALRFNGVKGGDRDPFFDAYYPKMNAVIHVTLKKLREEHTGLLREYALTNADEFFAGAVEHFFEQPARMKAELPEVYHHLCLLLNQDPAEKGALAFDVRERLWPKEEAPEGSPALVAGKFNALFYYASLIATTMGFTLTLLNISGVTKQFAGFFLLLIGITLLRARLGFRTRISVFENGVKLERVRRFRVERLFIPYSMITKMEYEETFYEERNENEFFYPFRTRVVPSGRIVANLYMYFLVPFRGRSAYSVCPELSRERLEELHTFIRRQQVWMHVKPYSWTPERSANEIRPSKIKGKSRRRR